MFGISDSARNSLTIFNGHRPYVSIDSSDYAFMVDIWMVVIPGKVKFLIDSNLT